MPPVAPSLVTPSRRRYSRGLPSGACLSPCRTTRALTTAPRDRSPWLLAAAKLAARPRPKVLPRALPPDRRLNPPAFSAAANAWATEGLTRRAWRRIWPDGSVCRHDALSPPVRTGKAVSRTIGRLPGDGTPHAKRGVSAGGEVLIERDYGGCRCRGRGAADERRESDLGHL